MLRERFRLPATLLSVLVAMAAIWLSGCGDDDSTAGGTTADGGSAKLTLVAYSTPREVYEKLIPAFQATDAGTGVEFEQSYAASGEQSRAVEAGLPADYVAFSLAPDVDRLVKAGLVAEDWAAQKYEGMVSTSVVALIVRPGNPKGIRTWDDLLRDDVEVLTPNVFTSGGAKWNTMAAYGAQLQLGKTPAQAEEYLTKLYANVSVQDKSARESLQTFIAGKGDVLLGYENEAILAKEKGEEIDFVVPDETLLIENPAAVVSSSKSPDQAQAWLDYVQSPEAQKVFGEAGYRPVDPDVAKGFDYPQPSKLFTIDDLGGWSKVNDEFFDRDAGVVAEIFKNQGKAIE